MDGSASSVLSLGMGSWGSTGLVLTLGLGVGSVKVSAPKRLITLTGPNTHPYALIGPDPTPHVLTGPQSEPHGVTV